MKKLLLLFILSTVSPLFATTYEYTFGGTVFTAPEILPPGFYNIPNPDYLPGHTMCPGLAWVGCAGGSLVFGPHFINFTAPYTYDLVDFQTGGVFSWLFAPDALQALGTYPTLEGPDYYSGYMGVATISIAPPGTPTSYMPEPASIWLVSLAAAGLLLWRKIRIV